MDLEDSVEISDLVSKISANPQHLDALLNEADQHGHRDILEGMWMEDTSRAQFLHDQLTNSKSSKQWMPVILLFPSTPLCTETGSKVNRWSLVTYRIGISFEYVCVCMCMYACVHVFECLYIHVCTLIFIMIFDFSSCNICEKSCL